ncbi:hypothetical protein [Acidiphilium acidophilum]|uniref:hypothetical protein n=1 Tax=Acidiphilium acidophilum TaxID=76588 RepID=UPI002E8E62B9|nr:hypothetical protein [Acidiphilium acidophilum]
MPRQRIPGLKDIKRTDLSAMSRVELEELTWDLHELARALANRAGEDSTTSSRPPSSDNPYRRNTKSEQSSDRSDRDDKTDGGGGSAPGGNASGGTPGPKPAGKRPGTKGFWRRLPIIGPK